MANGRDWVPITNRKEVKREEKKEVGRSASHVTGI